MADNEEIFELSELDILSVGLVEAGAIGADFFAIKSEKGDSTMADKDKKQEETQETLIEKLKGMFATKEDMTNIQAELEKAAETPDEKTSTETPLETPTEDSAILKRLDEMEKARESEIALLQKANEDMKTELEKAKEIASNEKEAREKREYLEKAYTLKAFPVSYAELGDFLHKVSKSMPDEYNWLFELLKTADTQLGAAGIFNEMGTTKTPEELEIEQKVEKAVSEGKSPKEAVLSLSKAEQQQMLDESRGV